MDTTTNIAPSIITIFVATLYLMTLWAIRRAQRAERRIDDLTIENAALSAAIERVEATIAGEVSA